MSEIDHLNKTRLSAADHLGNVINTFITCDDRRVRRSILLDAVDALADYAVARGISKPPTQPTGPQNERA